MDGALSRDQIERAKNLVWARFVVNVSREENPAVALAESGYNGQSVPVILRAARFYRQTGTVPK